MIICKRPVHPDDHLQKDVPFADAMGMVFFSKQCNTDVFGHMLSSQMMQLFGLNHPWPCFSMYFLRFLVSFQDLPGYF